jgi:hypothetical protein
VSGTRETGKELRGKIDAEAAKAEAEEPTEPTEPTEPEPDEDEPTEPEEPETPAEPEPAADLTGPQAQKAFDGAVTAFKSELLSIFGVDDLATSDTPGVIGFVLPGFTEQKTHENFTRCLTCNGYGTVLTGSMKAGAETRECPDQRCKGRGYWQKHVPEAAPQPPTLVPLPSAQPNGSGEWGEAPAWMGDPNLSAPSPAV